MKNNKHGEIIKVFTIEVGDIYTCPTTEIAIEQMKTLHEGGIETKLYSYHNGTILRSYEITHIAETQSNE
jgi:hypothetical protein